MYADFDIHRAATALKININILYSNKFDKPAKYRSIGSPPPALETGAPN